MKKILHYRSMLQNPRNILVQPVELFQHGCMDKWRSGDFSIQTWCIPLEAFTSKNLKANFIF